MLDDLIGDWQVTTEWKPIADGAVHRLRGRMETQWIVDGRVLESRSFDDDGHEVAKVLVRLRSDRGRLRRLLGDRHVDVLRARAGSS